LEQLIGHVAGENGKNGSVRLGAVSAAHATLSCATVSAERQKAEEDRERARDAHKKANEQAIDEDYKSLIERTPSANKKVDPWGNLRAPGK
jgi:hypothetical protein